MMMKRNRSTPFEVMGQATRSVEPAREPASHGGMSDDGRGGWGERFSRASDWWASLGAGSPVVLRVPRGLAVVLVVALVGLLMLAYWVGHSRGVSAGTTATARQERVDDEPAIRRAPARRADAAGTTEPTTAGRTSPSTAGAGGLSSAEVGTPLDPREPGLNYFVLASYPPQAAQTLATWLRAEHGVATVLESVQNRRLREVIAVDRGFNRDELYSDSYQEYERALRDVGRSWQRHNNGRGDALDTMYPKRYDGP